MRGSKAIIFLTAAILTAPVGAATWFSYGSYEPDTIQDVSGPLSGWMYQNPDTDASGMKVYFNGIGGSGPAYTNPNNEVAGSRVFPIGANQMRAYLGIWKDCNNDGYIGAGNGALIVYQADVGGLDPAICTDGSVFNRGGWVYEFQWIGPGLNLGGSPAYPSADDQRWVNDSEAMVWVDYGLPGSPNGGTCPITPLPQGTQASTGGALLYLDCFTARRVANTVNQADAAAGGNTGLGFDDPRAPHKSDSLLNQDFPVHLWHDPNGGEDNMQNDTGALDENSQRDWSDESETDEDTAFTVWDCSQPEATTVDSPVTEAEDPTGGELEEDGTITIITDEDGHLIELAALSPSVDDPVGGSYYDSLNATERGALNAEGGGGTGALTLTGESASNCDREHTTTGMEIGCGDGNDATPDSRKTTVWCFAGIEFASQEGRSAATSAAKKQPNDHFNFVLTGNAARGKLIGNTRVGDPVNDGDPLAADPANDTLFSMNGDDELRNETGDDSGGHLNNTLGEGYTHGLFFHGAVLTSPIWNAGHTLVNTQGTINRNTLEPNNAFIATFYARIGAATTSTGALTANNNVAGIYGNEWCGGATSGTSPDGSFDCDATHWYNPVFGSEAMPTANGRDVGAKAGYAFHLRDIDCWDNTVVRGVPVHASTVDVSANGPCVDAP